MITLHIEADTAHELRFKALDAMGFDPTEVMRKTGAHAVAAPAEPNALPAAAHTPPQSGETPPAAAQPAVSESPKKPRGRKAANTAPAPDAMPEPPAFLDQRKPAETVVETDAPEVTLDELIGLANQLLTKFGAVVNPKLKGVLSQFKTVEGATVDKLKATQPKDYAAVKAKFEDILAGA